MEMITANMLPFHNPAPSKEKEFIAQTILALQHLFRIGRATDVKQWTGAIAFLSSCSPSESRTRAKIAIKAWNLIHQAAYSAQRKASDGEDEDDEEDMDVWDLRNRSFGFQTTVEGKVKKEGDKRNLLPDYTSFKELEIPPVFVVEVEALPRGADIEWFDNGVTDAGMASSLQSWHAIEHIEELGEFTAKERAWAEYTIYTTKALPKKLLDLRPVVIPCFRVWCEGGDRNGAVEIEAVVGVREYPI
jgi:diphthine-ammonia ligase